MFVVVPLVGRVATAVVYVVDMITVRYGDMPATLPVHMIVAVVCVVRRRFAFIEMTVVGAMNVPVVDVVHMVAVRESDVTTAFPVDMAVIGVFLMQSRGHRTSEKSGAPIQQTLLHCQMRIT